MTPDELLKSNRIELDNVQPGRHYTTCPECSARRKPAHQKNKCLGVTIEGDRTRWGCSHCGWTGPSSYGGNGARPPLAAYLYRDRDRNVRFRKVRNLPGREPRFWLQHWDENAGWLKGAEGADTSILYRIDEIADAIEQGRVIAVVEGEKDADNLWKLDIPATCNAHGASKPEKKPKWTARHSEQLRGADIVVFNDNDPAGYAHADTVCKLSRGVAKRVRRLDLKDDWPEIPEGRDVSDWIDAGGEHTAELLKELIERAPDCVADAEESDEKPERIPQRDKIIKAVLDAKVTFWRDADGEAFATVPREGPIGDAIKRIERYPVRSTAFRNIVRGIYGDAFPSQLDTPGAISDTAWREARPALEAIAFKGLVRSPDVRLYRDNNGVVWIDLGDSTWRLVRVDQNGWRIEASADVPLIRPHGLRPLFEPRRPRADTLNKFAELLNIRTDRNRSQHALILIVSWGMAALYPIGPYCVLAIDGESGCGKTTLCRMLRNCLIRTLRSTGVHRATKTI